LAARPGARRRDAASDAGPWRRAVGDLPRRVPALVPLRRHRADPDRCRAGLRNSGTEPELVRAPSPNSELHWLPVAGEFQVAAPELRFLPEGTHRALPIDRSDAGARVELLVVHQRLEAQIVHLHRYGVLDAGAGRAPPAQRLHG